NFAPLPTAKRTGRMSLVQVPGECSRWTELKHHWSGHVLDAWLGHSEKVARAHYLRVREEDFQRAAKNGAATSAAAGADSQMVLMESEEVGRFRDGASGRKSLQDGHMTPTGFEPVSRP